MDAGSLLVGLSLALIAAVAVADPFQRVNRNARAKRQASRGSPETRREQVLLALRDLDFDFHTSKVEEEDYLSLRRHLMAEAARLSDTMDSARADLEAKIEPRGLARRAQGIQVVLCQACGNGVQAGDRFCARCGNRLDLQCSVCGLSRHEVDNFCAGCGSPTHLGEEG